MMCQIQLVLILLLFVQITYWHIRVWLLVETSFTLPDILLKILNDWFRFFLTTKIQFLNVPIYYRNKKIIHLKRNYMCLTSNSS